MTWIEWLLGIVASVTVIAVTWIINVMGKLPVDYVPRGQIDSRFRDLEHRLHTDIRMTENRADKRFDAIDAKLDKIIEKMEGKADK